MLYVRLNTVRRKDSVVLTETAAVILAPASLRSAGLFSQKAGTVGGAGVSPVIHGRQLA